MVAPSLAPPSQAPVSLQYSKLVRDSCWENNIYITFTFAWFVFCRYRDFQTERTCSIWMRYIFALPFRRIYWINLIFYGLLLRPTVYLLPLELAVGVHLLQFSDTQTPIKMRTRSLQTIWEQYGLSRLHELQRRDASASDIVYKKDINKY